MTIRIEFSPEIEARLREQARASGKEIEGFVSEAVEAKLAAAHAPVAGEVDGNERLKLFREWVASHPSREGIHMDDSRESIYEGRGE
jgi:hypothetical protein